MLLGRFELPASSLPMTCSTPELQQHRLMGAVLPPSPLTRKTLPMRLGKHGYLLKSGTMRAENIFDAVH